METFLRRLDTNGNGMIDAEEVAGDQKSLVEGMFRRAGIELKYPIPISRILAAMTDSSRRSRSDGSGEAAAEPGQEASPDHSTPGASTGGSSQPKPSQSAVPGFGSPAVAGTKSSPTASSSEAATSTPPPTSSSSSPSAAKAGETSTAPATTAADPAPAPPRGSGRFRTARERLPDGLPDWFRQKDLNGDGQITMAEFSREWTPEIAAEFERFDLNHDGIITAAECLKVLKAEKHGRK
jgi:Ca2+-binding EF-hand superfamily protein